jgi:hypothetical protein
MLKYELAHQRLIYTAYNLEEGRDGCNGKDADLFSIYT